MNDLLTKQDIKKLIVSILNKMPLTEGSVDDFCRLSNLLLKSCKDGITQDEFAEIKILNNKY